jgi:hypothetical protein
MATIVKLTYTQTGKVTLVNLDQMTSAFRIFERTTRKYATRIGLGGEQYVVVDEELQEIHRLAQEVAQGNFQSADWVQMDEGIPNGDDFVDRLENDYQRNTYPRHQQREYRPRQQYNGNRW